jgi:hypothetical protein|uniref:hypothetical protein n=1 Tax=Candidatus Limnocylindrus sp. TaxID=2802978 RepID=UPI004049D83D
MKETQRTPWLVAAALVALIVGSAAAPRTFGWGAGLVAAADEELIDGDPITDESADPDESTSPDESLDSDASAPSEEEPEPDPGQDPGEEIDPDATDGEGGEEGDVEASPSDEPATPTPPALTLGDLLAAATASTPFDADLALQILQEYAPPGARAIEVADRQTFRSARTYAIREVRSWSRLPQLGTSSATVWMRFVGGSERTPFAVAAGQDRTDPRISSVRVREGRASRGNPAPYLLKITGTDSGTGTVAIEVRVGYEKPLRFAAGDEIEIGPFMKSTGGKVVLLMRGVTVEVRLIDAAGNESSWRRVRLP